MDNMAYLQQIATKPKDNGSSGFDISKFLNAKTLIIAGVSLVVLIILMVALSALGSSGKSASQKAADALAHAYLRGQNINTTVEKYRPNLKSSDLRAMSSTLSSVITASETALTPFVPQGEGGIAASAEVSGTETADLEELTATLENARLNALLDRTYVREMTLQIALYRSYLTETSARTDDANLQAAIATILNDLDKVATDFENFSDKSN